MPGLHQSEHAGSSAVIILLVPIDSGNHRFGGFCLFGIFCFGQCQVQLGNQRQISGNRGFICSHFGAESCQDSLYLPLFFYSKLPQLITWLYNCPGLYKYRGSGVGDVVHNALDVLPILSLDRDNVSAISLGNKRLLKKLLVPA